ncbi:hypothetical protein AVEN_41858-1 [Araneus ventricosus]|uniref:Uncharacterized protein n=1 Tax=Araneus ventricosus TaxID=182803 RepID=A0A4Y2AC88_ARAVE|nr:hypothetical protein AVEN_41858-1 [Araneus ventricosus]
MSSSSALAKSPILFIFFSPSLFCLHFFSFVTAGGGGRAGTTWLPFVRRPEWRQSFASGVLLPWLREGEGGRGWSAKATTDAAASLSISLLLRIEERWLIAGVWGMKRVFATPLRCPSDKPPSSI